MTTSEQTLDQIGIRWQAHMAAPSGLYLNVHVTDATGESSLLRASTEASLPRGAAVEDVVAQEMAAIEDLWETLGRHRIRRPTFARIVVAAWTAPFPLETPGGPRSNADGIALRARYADRRLGDRITADDVDAWVTDTAGGSGVELIPMVQRLRPELFTLDHARTLLASEHDEVRRVGLALVGRVPSGRSREQAGRPSRRSS